MASTLRKTRVIGNTGRKVFGGAKKKYKKKASSHRPNVGHIVGFSLAGNPGKKGRHMAATKSKKKKGSRSHGGYSKSKYKGNPGHKGGHSHTKKYSHKRHNPGGLAGVGPILTNATFVIVGGVLSRAGAQVVLGSNNTGVVGYAANVAVGGILWFLARNVMKSPVAASGIIAGTAVALIMRVLNDYTPFGQYISQLGMGDYQMQSFVTPQVLVDPWHSAEIGGPGTVPAWGAPALPAPPPAMGVVPAGTAMPAHRGTGGLYGGGWGSSLYGA